MGIVDWIIVIVLCAAFVIGHYRGFIKQALRLLGFIIALIVAYKYDNQLAPWLEKTFPIAHDQASVPVMLAHMLDIDAIFYRAVAFALLFFGTRLVLFGVGAVANTLSLVPGIGTINRWLGAALSVLEAVLILYIAIQISLVMPWPKVHSALEHSVIYEWSSGHTEGISTKLFEWWSNGENKQINKSS